MTDKQELELLAYLKIIAQNTAILVAQGQLQRPLDGGEIGQCTDSVKQAAGMLAAGLELGVLPPGAELQPSR